MKQYNKLVRDKIPEIIAQNGDTAQTHIADDSEYRELLYKKLAEEVAELTAEPSIEEAADIAEVLLALYELEGWNQKEIEKVRKEKVDKRGGFSKRIILDHTD